MMLGALVVAALSLTACGHEGGNEEEGGGGSSSQEYPSTADVIRNAVKDIDGNKYDAVKVGNQVWMASNLRTTRYADGTAIPLGETTSTTEPYRYAPGTYQSNEENMVNVPAYGYLYNWAAVMRGAESSDANPSGVQGICPKGWHVPSDAEWTQLTDYMKTRPEYMSSGNSNYIAKALAATWGWESSSDPDDVGFEPSTTNNATGFSAKAAGHYSNLGTTNHYFYAFGGMATFWTTTDGGCNDRIYMRHIYHYGKHWQEAIQDKHCGLSVRCVRN